MTLQNNYCITGYIHTWISNFLSMRKQRVDIDGGYYLRLDKCAFGRATGHSFRPTPLFALHHYDLPHLHAISSRVRLFAD